MAIEGDDNNDWSVESDYAPPVEGESGPPADWPRPSWYNDNTGDWYWHGKLDPCPVKALGHIDDQYVFITGARAVRRFTSSHLHGGGGPNDLFGGKLDWALRHFRRYDTEKKELVGGLQKQRLMGAMIRMCIREGYYDNTRPHRSIGTWRGPNGEPLIHAGDMILYAGRLFSPGETIGDCRYVIGPRREPPALEFSKDGCGYRLLPGSIADCHRVAARIDEWNWLDEEGRNLFLGGLCCDMLGDALHWKSNRFIRAQPGSGKSSLLKYQQALLGAAAHPIERTYTRSRLEQKFSNTSCALLLDELESDTDGGTIRRVFEVIRLMSDDGATGGRGSSSGQARDISLHGTVTMVATLAEAWRPQDRSRIAYIELGRLRDREEYQARSQNEMEAVFAEAAEMSARVRARVLDRFPLFGENLARVRARILELGGSPRDADQLGHLIAGWATMTGDEPLDEDAVGKLDRFKPYIMTIAEEEDGSDDPSECFHTLLGLPSGIFERGRELTLGQIVAAAPEPNGDDMRAALRGLGLCLQRQKSQVTGHIETWPEAWLAVANKHPKLEKLFTDYPQYKYPKRGQLLSELRRVVSGGVQRAAKSEGPIKFGGVPSRAWLIPPVFLPSVEDDRDEL
jgi:hypothetical protein